MPGGGAEIFDDRVHDEVFKGKVRADKWFHVHRTAHLGKLLGVAQPQVESAGK